MFARTVYDQHPADRLYHRCTGEFTNVIAQILPRRPVGTAQPDLDQLVMGYRLFDFPGYRLAQPGCADEHDRF